METLLAIRPNEAVIDPATSVFGLSASQIYRRVKAATNMAGLGDGTAPPCRPRTPRPRPPAREPWLVLPGRLTEMITTTYNHGYCFRPADWRKCGTTDSGQGTPQISLFP